MRLLFAAAVALAPGAVSAQAPAASVPTTTVDPMRLEAAGSVIDQVWPLGTYARIMHTTMDQVVSGALAGMYDLTPGQLSIDEKRDPAASRRSLGQLAKQQDPAFDERMRITMRVMTDGVADLMTQVEPEVRIALGRAYARRFTVAELKDLHSFFNTPTGKIYARDSMMLMAGPDMMKAMQAFMPKMLQALPTMMVKVEAATKHLPPVKKMGAPQ